MFAHTVSTIGGIYFVFINTLKMDKAMLIRTVKKTWSVSMTALFVPLLISLLISHMLRDHIPGIHKGGSITIVVLLRRYLLLLLLWTPLVSSIY